MTDYPKILEDLKQPPQTWHDSGLLDDSLLEALADHFLNYDTITRIVETGAGKSTLFLSQTSCNDTVFAIDLGKSLTRIWESEFLKSDVVEFVDGPTRVTLPAYEFSEKLDIVLVDDPHGYPFPAFKYYYFYPHIKEGGLLIIDDLHHLSDGWRRSLNATICSTGWGQSVKP